MKKIIIFAISAMLCFVMLIPVSAETNYMVDYNGVSLPDLESVDAEFDKTLYPYVYIYYYSTGRTYYGVFSRNEPMKSTTDVNVRANDIHFYTIPKNGTEWSYGGTLDTISCSLSELTWSKYHIYDYDNNLVFSGNMDIPKVTHTIPAGLYIFNPTPTMPTEDITQDFTTYFSVMINNGLENVVYNGLRMKFTPTTIEYNLDGTLTTVYKGPPLADVGWSHDGYRQVTFIEDVAVSEEFYNLFMANTTPPPEYKPPYVFSNDGITYDGSTYATYESDDTKRIEIDGKYCCMFQSNSYTFVATASEPLRLHTSTIKTKSGERLEYWTIKNGIITYSGDKLDFAIPHSWIAGNHSILNWDDDLQYHGFDIGMVFPTTPQTQLPTVVGAEMMMGVTREMIAILPCLIALLTALLGLRKALSILRMILETA